MPLRLVEFFGFDPQDTSPAAVAVRRDKACPFVGGRCIKTVDTEKFGTLISGACTVAPTQSGPVIVCPNRMYAGDYAVLSDVATACFGAGVRLCRSRQDAERDGNDVFVFGKRWGKELRVPNRAKKGSYFVDWVLAHVDALGNLKDFVAVELQTMDTTGSYQRQVAELYGLDLASFPQKQSNLNWENVAKRILIQLIYKGHVLHQEPLCTKGLFFVCPTPVYQRIMRRLGDSLITYKHPHPGALTFRWYNVGADPLPGTPRDLTFQGQMTTTIAQVELAFTSASNLPPAGVYELAIRAELER
jgi:hypothetical protein